MSKHTTKTKVKHIKHNGGYYGPSFGDDVEETIQKLEEENCEIINVTHGAGIGGGHHTREIYSALILYKESRDVSSKSSNY